MSCEICIYATVMVEGGTAFKSYDRLGEEVHSTQEDTIYLCRRYPPQPTGFPEVYAGVWCGEFAPKPDLIFEPETDIKEE